MPDALTLGYVPVTRVRGVLIVFCGENLKFGPATQKVLAPLGDLVRRAAAADRFTGKNGSSLDIIAPAGLNLPRLIVIGTGKESDLGSRGVVKLGGVAMGKVPNAAADATIVAEFGSGPLNAEQVADLARRAAARLRVRSLQDQTQGRRGANRQGHGQFRLRAACGGGKSRGAHVCRRRRRRDGARPCQ
jgi:leucyl aminopeptidase